VFLIIDGKQKKFLLEVRDFAKERLQVPKPSLYLSEDPEKRCDPGWSLRESYRLLRAVSLRMEACCE
jgi:hypothetical protein